MSEWITLVGARSWREPSRFVSRTRSADGVSGELHLWSCQKVSSKKLPDPLGDPSLIAQAAAEILSAHGGGVFAVVRDYGESATFFARGVDAVDSSQGRHSAPVEALLVPRKGEPVFVPLPQKPVDIHPGDHLMVPTTQGGHKALAGFHDLLSQVPADLRSGLIRPLSAPDLDLRVRKLELLPSQSTLGGVSTNLRSWVEAGVLSLLVFLLGAVLGGSWLLSKTQAATPIMVEPYPQAESAEAPERSFDELMDEQLAKLDELIQSTQEKSGVEEQVEEYRAGIPVLKLDVLKGRAAPTLRLIQAILLTLKDSGGEEELADYSKLYGWTIESKGRLSHDLAAFIDLLLCESGAHAMYREAPEGEEIDESDRCDLDNEDLKSALRGGNQAIDTLSRLPKSK